MENRVMKLSKNDYCYHDYRERILTRLRAVQIINVMDLIEYYNIYSILSSDKQYLQLESTTDLNKLKIELQKFLSKNSENIHTYILEIDADSGYYSVHHFVSIIYELNSKLLTDKILELLISLRMVDFKALLDLKPFLNYIKNNVGKVLKIKNKNLIILLVEYLLENEDKDIFDEKDTTKIINEYIENGVSLFHLQNICNSKNSKICTKTKYKCFQIIKREREKVQDSNNNDFFKVTMELSSGENIFKISNAVDSQGISYVEEWNFDLGLFVTENPSKKFLYTSIIDFLFNKFLLFNNNRIVVAHYNQDSIRGYKFLFHENYNSYHSKNFVFEKNEKIEILRLQLFLDYLLKKDINIYEVINYMIDQYLGNGFFSIGEFEKPYNSIHSINRNICIQIESLFAQYKCFLDINKVDPEYMLIGTESLELTKTKSSNILNFYVKNSYYNYLLDSQSGLYIEGKKLLKNNVLFDFILKESFSKILYNEFSLHNKKILKYGIDKNIFFWDNDILKFKNKIEAQCVKELFECGSLTIKKGSNELINSLINNDLFYFDENLFNKYEIDYFNYIFNNKVFNDSLALRNKYLHIGVIDIDEKIANIQLIKLLISVIYKIHLDLNIKKN